MIKNKSKFFAMDGPWGSSSGNNKPGSGGGFSGGGGNDSIDDFCLLYTSPSPRD